MTPERRQTSVPRVIMVTWHVAALVTAVLLGVLLYVTVENQRISRGIQQLSDSSLIELRELNETVDSVLIRASAARAQRQQDRADSTVRSILRDTTGGGQ